MVALKTTNIIVAGVGGQGNRTLTRIIALSALEAHLEVHVLSNTSLGRLGGSTICHIRLGPAVSAAIPMGEADIMVGLELNEALRTMHMLRRGALAFIHTYCRLPIVAGIEGAHYPSVDEVEKVGIARGITSIFVPEALQIVEHNQWTKSVNMIMLGIWGGHTKLLPRSLIEQSLSQCLPRCAEQNLRAFAAGWQYGEKLPQIGSTNSSN